MRARRPRTTTAGRVAIGTGPYRVVSHRNGDRIEFERNDQYWGERPGFARVNYRMITNDAARTAALLAGDVEFIDQVPTSDLAKLRRTSAWRSARRRGCASSSSASTTCAPTPRPSSPTTTASRSRATR